MKIRNLFQIIFCTALSVVALICPTMSVAADYPERPVTLIVPFAAGGTSDILARALALQMEKKLGKAVVVDNKPGANTIIAATTTAKAKADGYTIMMVAGSTMVLNPLMYKNLTYNPDQQLDLIALAGNIPLIAVVPLASSINTFDDLIAKAKEKKGEMTVATVGTGSTLDLGGKLFQDAAGVKLTEVAYKGSLPALLDVVAGRVDLMFDGPTTAMPLVKAGRLKALAVTSPKRFNDLPHLPAISERYPEVQVTVWYGIAAPKGLPVGVRNALKSAIDAALTTPDFIDLAKASMITPAEPVSDEKIKAYIDEERKRWGSLIRKHNIRLE